MHFFQHSDAIRHSSNAEETARATRKKRRAEEGVDSSFITSSLPCVGATTVSSRSYCMFLTQCVYFAHAFRLPPLRLLHYNCATSSFFPHCLYILCLYTLPSLSLSVNALIVISPSPLNENQFLFVLFSIFRLLRSLCLAFCLFNDLYTFFYILSVCFLLEKGKGKWKVYPSRQSLVFLHFCSC